MDYKMYFETACRRVKDKYPEAVPADLEALAHLEVNNTVQAQLHLIMNHGTQKATEPAGNKRLIELTGISREALSNLHKLGERRISLLEKYCNQSE